MFSLNYGCKSGKLCSMNIINIMFDIKRLKITIVSLVFCDVTMMLLCSQSTLYFNVKRTIWLKGYQSS